MAEKQEASTEEFLSGRTPKQDERSLAPWIIAGSIVVVIIGILIAVSLRSARPAASAVPDPYAAQLAISGLEMSQSSNMAGSQITYIDGQITNGGNRIVSGITVRTTFFDSLNQPGQQETIPLNLIRTRDPYVDIEPVAADPIKPGESKAFRLIFDHVSQDWNQQPPEIRILQVQLR